MSYDLSACLNYWPGSGGQRAARRIGYAQGVSVRIRPVRQRVPYAEHRIDRLVQVVRAGNDDAIRALALAANRLRTVVYRTRTRCPRRRSSWVTAPTTTRRRATLSLVPTRSGSISGQRGRSIYSDGGGTYYLVLNTDDSAAVASFAAERATDARGVLPFYIR